MVVLPFEFLKQNEPAPWSDITKLVESTKLRAVIIDKATGSGRPGVAFRIDLPDGTTVITQTTARLLCGMARAIEARYPDLFHDN